MSDHSEYKYELMNTKPSDCSNNEVENITEMPTNSINNTMSDIWSLVFGGIGQIAVERNIRYAIELEKYNEELQKKIDAIPENKRIDPDIQVVAPALEASKYCVQKEELRTMFVNLIVSSMNSDTAASVHPIFKDIISKLSPTDARLFMDIANNDFGDDSIIFNTAVETLTLSIAVLEQLGLINTNKRQNTTNEELNKNRIGGISNRKKCSLYQNNTSSINLANDELFLYHQPNNYYVFLLYNFERVYQTVADKMKKLSTEIIDEKAMLKKHKVVTDFFSTTIELTSMGRQFKKICL